MREPADELVFLPLGGVGEIGMNLGLYGFGPRRDRTWLAVDFGIAFEAQDAPGVDVIFPDIAYLEEERASLAGIVITHAHEDHFGALIDLWPRLRVPVYATAFTANLLMAKLASEPGAEVVPITLVTPGKRFTVGPFDVEYINVTHSVPESHALAIRTPLGIVLHSGDWKLDPTPVLGAADRRRASPGDRPGRGAGAGLRLRPTPCARAAARARRRSRASLPRSSAPRTGRIAFTTFSSNVSRLRSIALAAQAAGREVVVIGRAIRRVLDVAGELGMLEGLPPFLEEEAYQHLPRNKVVALVTGSQGEPRAALARIATEEHRNVVPRPRRYAGLLVPRHSRQRDRDQPHRQQPDRAAACASSPTATGSSTSRAIRGVTNSARCTAGSSRRSPCRSMARRCISPPMPSLRSTWACRSVKVIGDGDVLRLAPGPVEKVDEVEAGRIYRDGNADRRPRGNGHARTAPAVLRRPCRRFGGARRARRDVGRSRDRADRPAARRPRRPAVPGERDGTRSSARSTRFPARGDATPRSCARRSVAPFAPESPRPGARSRIAPSSSRSYDGAMIGRLNHVAIAVPGRGGGRRGLSRQPRRQGLRADAASRSMA